MLRYALHRIAAVAAVLLVVSTAVFFIVYLTPGSPSSALLGMEATADQIQELDARLGFDRPLPEQYLSWMGSILQGDLGDSLFMDEPVTQAIAEHFAPTLAIAVSAQTIALLVAVPCGILAAVRRGRALDGVLRVASLVGVAVPGFLMALILVMAFAMNLRLFPVAGYAELSEGFAAYARYLVLPSLALAAPQAALLMRMTRASMIEALEMDCVKTARAKGLPERTVVLKHALRNAAAPILTAVGYSFGGLITGAVVIEVIFNIPGLGQLVTDSIARRDYPVIQGSILVVSFLYCLVNLVVDLACSAFDPRMRVWEHGDE